MSLSPCGIDCSTCYLGEKCPGCQQISGKPFYLADFNVEVCPLFDCPVNQNGYKSCAECDKLPCDTYQNWRDPSMTDEQHQASIEARVNTLRG